MDKEKVKHTPSPWRRGELLKTKITSSWSSEEQEHGNKEEQKRIFALFKNSDEGRSRIHVATINHQNVDYEANARLIASAPEILEALKLAKSYLPHGVNYTGPFRLKEEDVKNLDSIVKAIAKAEGGNQ